MNISKQLKISLTLWILAVVCIPLDIIIYGAKLASPLFILYNIFIWSSMIITGWSTYDKNTPKKFKMTHVFFTNSPAEIFTEDTAPTWLTCENTTKGSTADMRWFWENHILTLKVGESKETDFRIIKRIK
jgi:hypothetical protein